MNRDPNFFIIGAPKCGTTALRQYLGEHPRVFMSTPKEPHFFSTDLPSRGSVRTLEAYRALFRHAEPEHRAVGEASVWYLYSRYAVPAILERYPDARLIVMVRDPIEMLHSLYSQLKFTADEDAPDFETAWRYQTCRMHGKRLPASDFDVALLQYGELGKHGAHISRVLDLAGQRQVKIIVYDDFCANPRGVYEDVLGFLDVEPDARTLFPRVNTNKTHRIGALGKFIMQPPPTLLSAVNKFKNISGIERVNVLPTLLALNTRTEGRKPLSRDFRQELAEFFERDVARLETLLDRSLDGWLRV